MDGNNIKYKPKTFLPFLFDYERKLVEKYGIEKPLHPVIAISGFSGTGKNTHANLLRERILEEMGIDLEIFDAGKIVREIAVKSGISEDELYKFYKKYKNLEELDKEIEKETLRKIILKGGIFVGRMSCFTAGKWGFKIWLTAPLEIIVKRIVSDPHRPEYGMDIEKAKEYIKKRDDIDKQRLEKTYGIKFDELVKKVDLIVENIGDVKIVNEKIFTHVRKFLSKFL